MSVFFDTIDHPPSNQPRERESFAQAESDCHNFCAKSGCWRGDVATWQIPLRRFGTLSDRGDPKSTEAPIQNGSVGGAVPESQAALA
ncbi:MAG: hypothetical protein H6747_04220 [Deltaproteobacteria bacterium]|nr:hypothetical protein [Deltaproteobacteria bacterium]